MEEETTEEGGMEEGTKETKETGDKGGMEDGHRKMEERKKYGLMVAICNNKNVAENHIRESDHLILLKGYKLL